MSIQFQATLSTAGPLVIIRITPEISETLPSRGMVMIEGTINGFPFTAPLEPDGKGSHWFEVNAELMEKAEISVGSAASLSIEPLEEWPEPVIPQNIINAVKDANLLDRWQSITSKARWDWLRWIRATKNPATRQKRIAVACSKLQAGDNNPCCFDRSRCTVPEVSKNGVLIDS